MPLFVILLGGVGAVVAMLVFRRPRPRPPAKPPVWQDPRAPADTLAAPRRNDEHHLDHQHSDHHSDGDDS